MMQCCIVFAVQHGCAGEIRRHLGFFLGVSSRTATFSDVAVFFCFAEGGDGVKLEDAVRLVPRRGVSSQAVFFLCPWCFSFFFELTC